jgi:hypothetical protein
MYPHERSLVKRLAGKPFALLGINCDGDNDFDHLKQLIADSGISWRFWCETPDNPISAKWEVQYLPTVFVLDAQGVIRLKHVGGVSPQELDRVIDQLVAETNKQA